MNYLIYPDKMMLKLVRRQKLIYVEKPQFATSGDYSQPRTSFPRHVFLATVTCWSLLKGKYLLKDEGAQNRVVAYLIEWITVLVAEKDHVINESLQHALRSQNYRKVHGVGEGRGSFFYYYLSVWFRWKNRWGGGILKVCSLGQFVHGMNWNSHKKNWIEGNKKFIFQNSVGRKSVIEYGHWMKWSSQKKMDME